MNLKSRLTRSFVVAGVLVVSGLAAKRARRAPQPPAADAPPSASSVPAPSANAELVRAPLAHVSTPGVDVEQGTIQGNTLWGYTELTIDLERARLEIVTTAHGASLERLLPESALAIVNGGYFEASYRPSAWLRSGGVDLAPKLEVDKGGVFAVRGARAAIEPLGAQSFDPELALQSFPLIVDPDGSLGIHHDDGRRAARTVACLRGGSPRLIVISAARGEGPTLFEAAPLFRNPPPGGFGCSVALNLDGGPSSGVCFGAAVSARSRSPLAPVANGIAILPKLSRGQD